MLRYLQKTLRQRKNPVLLKKYYTTIMSSFEEPTAGEAKKLFEKLKQKFPSKTLGAERWYLVAVKIFITPAESIPWHIYRSLLSQEAGSPNLPEICTRIWSKDHTILRPKPDRLLFVDWEKHSLKACQLLGYAGRLRRFLISTQCRDPKIKITLSHGTLIVVDS